MIYADHVIRSERTQVFKKFTPLLLVVPGHCSDVKYHWAKKTASDAEWVALDINTCLLYAGQSGTYRCFVAGEEYYFQLLGTCMIIIFMYIIFNKHLALLLL